MTAAEPTNPGPIVVKLGGVALEPGGAPDGLWAALASLHGREPGGLVLAHGGAAAADRLLADAGHTTERIDGLRVTSDEQVDLVVAALAGLVSKRLVHRLTLAGARAAGISLLDGPTVHARRLAHPSGDLGRVGDPTGGDASLTRALLAAGVLPVVASIAADDDGFLNVNADDAASALVTVLGARAALFLTTAPGVLDERGELVPDATPAELDDLIGRGVIAGGMIPKARAAIRAARDTGAPVTIASFQDPDTLERLAAREPVGTTVHPETADHPKTPASPQPLDHRA